MIDIFLVFAFILGLFSLNRNQKKKREIFEIKNRIKVDGNFIWGRIKKSQKHKDELKH